MNHHMITGKIWTIVNDTTAGALVSVSKRRSHHQQPNDELNVSKLFQPC
jgi:hypothetical protein